MWFIGFLRLANVRISPWLRGTWRMQDTPPASVSNSAMSPLHNASPGSFSNAPSCSRHLPGSAMSSLSIRATSPYRQRPSPSFSAPASPRFSSRRTTWNSPGYPDSKDETAWSSPAVSGPSHTSTKSLGGTVWPSMLCTAATRYSADSFLYTDINTEYPGYIAPPPPRAPRPLRRHPAGRQPPGCWPS